MRLIDSFITQLKAQGPSRTCNESKQEERHTGIDGTMEASSSRRAGRGGTNPALKRGGLVFKAHRLLYHSTLGLRVVKKKKRRKSLAPRLFWMFLCRTDIGIVLEREFFIDNQLVRIHFIIVMIRWTGLAPWECEFPFP